MASAMQLYAAFALLMIAIIVIIVLAAVVGNLIGTIRRRFGRNRSARTQSGTRHTHDDFSPPSPPSRPAPRGSRSDNSLGPR
jgi:hypothetical protein